jgi:diguanylate cyclase (GGDEF)-like protein/PAS domain S-box-containing protein
LCPRAQVLHSRAPRRGMEGLSTGTSQVTATVAETNAAGAASRTLSAVESGAFRPITFGFAAVCAVVAAGDLLLLTHPLRLPLAAVFGGMAALLALVGWRANRRDVPSHWRTPLLAAVTLLLLSNVAATAGLGPDAAHRVYFAVVAVVCVALPLPTRWRGGLFLSTLAVWCLTAMGSPTTSWPVEILTFAGAMTGSVVAAALRARVGEGLEALEQQAGERHTALVDSQNRFDLAMAGSNDGLYDWDLTRDTIDCSERLVELLGGYGPERIEIRSLTDRIHPDDADRVRDRLISHLKGETEFFEDEFRIRDSEGAYSWVLARGASTRNAEGRAVRMAGSITDMTRRGVFDALTGLPNRRLFMDRLRRLTNRGRAEGDADGFDDFKLVNDSLGHKTGDDLLREVGKRLQTCVRAIDTVARLGGDEFVVLLEKVKVPVGVQITIDRILGKLLEPYELDQREIHARPSMGVVMDTRGYDSPDDILRDADTAMYRAKEQGRPFVVFDVTMRERLTRRLQLESDLRRALQRHEFVVHFQSIVSLESGEVEGYEALVRWEHPERGLLAPAEFIEVMEETGLVVPLGKQVLYQACRHMAEQFSDRSVQDMPYLSVNLSGKHLAQEDLADELEVILGETGFDAHRLRIDITETAIVDNPRRAASALARIKMLGVQIQMDDFGTGHSSLSYLQTLPIDTLKIDRSFVARMTTEEDGRELVWTIIRMAQSLGLNVVAEGIETTEQVGILREMECQSGQGFLFARPDELGAIRTRPEGAEPSRGGAEPELAGRTEGRG